MAHSPVKQGILNVKVLRAMNLKSKRYFGACDPYVQLFLSGTSDVLNCTSVKRKSLNPTWYEEFNLDVKDLDSHSLILMVYDYSLNPKRYNVIVGFDPTSEDHVYMFIPERNKRYERDHHECRLGSSCISLKDLTLTPEEVKTLTIDLEDKSNQISGQIVIAIAFYAHGQIPINLNVEGVLYVAIVSGTFLQGVHHTNPSVRLLFQGNKGKTKSVKRNENPEWFETFAFVSQKPPMNEILHLEVISTSWMGLIYPKERLGFVDINLTDVVNNEGSLIQQTFNLMESENGQLLVWLRWVA